MQSAALLAERRKGVGAFPVLRVGWTARGLDLGTGIYSPSMRETAAGGVTAVTRLGGWGTIKYGSGINESGLKAVETSVSVADTDGTLINMLETYDPRGSQAVIDWAAPGLAAADWEPVFSGVVMDWKREALFTKLILKTDDTLLRSPVPPGVYNRAEWGSASEATIYGTSMPLVLGVHDSWQVTQRGMVAATNIRYDKDQGYWWLASVDRMIEITKIYFDGIPQGIGGWSVLRGVYGQSFLTIIVLATGYQPEKGVVVAFDCEAMDENGLTSGSALTGAPDQLRATLEEYTFRPAPLRGWRGPLSICEPTSWDAVSEFFALHKIESAHKTGGDQEPENAAAVVESFLAAYTWVRMWWTETGQIAIMVIDPDEESDPSTVGWLDLQKHHEGGQVPFEPGDRREVYTHIKMPFMWSSAEQKYLTAYEAHDVAALPEKLELSTDNPWSQCRFGDPAGALNPAPPADPALPPLTSASPSPSVPPPFGGHATLPNQLVSYFYLNESGNSARVDTPGGFNMTVSGTVTDTASGKNGNALRVDTSGHNGYLDSTTDNGTTGSDRSYSFWAWFTSSGTPACYAIQEVSSGLFNMQLQGFNSGGPRFFGVIYDNTGVSVGAQTSVLSTGTWHHVVVTVDTVAKEMKVYIDTLLDLTLSRTLPLRSLSPAGRRFFRFVSGSEVRFDEMVIWSRVISGPEITDLNNGGAGLFY